MQIPDYSGGSLLNLVAEFEQRLTGTAQHPGLHPELAATIPDADSYLFVLFDGLGDHQLQHPAAVPLLSREVKPWPGTVDVEDMPSTENPEDAR